MDWVACLIVELYGWWLTLRLEIILLLRHISCILICLSCMAFMPSMGRGQISVKLTGHARFSVENYKTYFRKYKFIFKEINWIKGDLFYLLNS